MKKFKALIRNNKGKIFLFALTTLTIFLFVKGTIISEEYNSRLKNKISVISTVTDIQEKTRTEETSIETGDGVEFIEEEVTYYKIVTTYEYNNQKYNYSFNCDYLYINDNSADSYSIGKQLPLLIDSTDPGYVLDGNPGNTYRVISYILAGLLGVILIYCGIYKLFPQHMFVALFSFPFLVGAILSVIWGINLIFANKATIYVYLLTFLVAPIFAAVSFLFFKISKMK